MKSRLKKLLLALAIIIGAIGIAALVKIPEKSPTHLPAQTEANVVINGVEYRVEVADTPDKRAGGLKNRLLLEENEGMLFAFDRPGLYDFWNKDTLIELDLIYINDDKIVERGFLPAYTKSQDPAVYYPQSEAEYVLELRKGQIPKHQFKVGDEVIIKR